MKPIWQVLQNKIIDLLNNPHTSLSGVIYMCLKVVGAIWPNRKPLMDELAVIAITYGLVQAGDAKPRTNGNVATPKPS